MDEDAFDNAQSAITMLETAAMLYETGRTDVLEYLASTSFLQEDEYEFALNGMHKLCDFMTERYSEDDDVTTMYFSSNTMMEYYRLCREYGALKRVSLKDNPYMLKAETEIREHMSEPDCYYCDYSLQTKINHKWASRIVFRYDCSYFCEFVALFSRLIYVFHFYGQAVKELRKEVEALKREKILQFPAVHAKERRAA